MIQPSPDPHVQRLAVSAVLIRDGAVLLVQRARGAAAGIWSFPGGHIEPGETAEVALQRELHEETGLTAHLAGRLGEHHLTTHDATGVVIQYVITVLYGQPAPGQLRAASDAADARMVPLDQVSALATTDGVSAYIARAARLLGT